MPSFGGMLPAAVIWDLTAYVRGISAEPEGQWGETISRDAFRIEQVPAEVSATVNPWAGTEPFGFGQPPFTQAKRPGEPGQ